jgi:hypothetical protein
MESEGSAPAPPIFRAVASSTRPLYQLLKAINFTNKVHIDITENGLRFAADHARVMQGGWSCDPKPLGTCSMLTLIIRGRALE